MTMIKAFTALAAFLGAANAHMVITSPVPMGQSVLTNSPLAADGSDFPCKSSVTGWDNIADGGGNLMTVGQPNQLAFKGGATHGGGSCQVSITSDTPPTKNSKWMVIQSIEGNCPASDSSENVSGSASNTAGLSTFQYTIPDHQDIPAGKNYTVAWTWHNKIGNREMYMNCASVQLQAAKKKRYAPVNYKRQSSALPAMFVANIGSGCTSAGCATSGCTTKETFNVKYPDPGQALIVGQGLSDLADPVGSGCGAVGSSGSGGSPSAASSGAAGAGSSAFSSAPTGFGGGSPTSGAGSAPTGKTFASAPGSGGGAPATLSQTSAGVFATGASSAASAVATVATSAAAPPASAATSASAPVGTGAGSSNSSPVLGAQSGACSDEGAWACAADGNSFQRCASGTWSAPMAMAAGTTCTPGQSAAFAESVSGKRSAIHRRRLSGMVKRATDASQ